MTASEVMAWLKDRLGQHAIMLECSDIIEITEHIQEIENQMDEIEHIFSGCATGRIHNDCSGN